MRLWQTLRSLWSGLTTFCKGLIARIFTKSEAAGVPRELTMSPRTQPHTQGILLDRLLICLILIVTLLLGALIIWTTWKP